MEDFWAQLSAALLPAIPIVVQIILAGLGLVLAWIGLKHSQLKAQQIDTAKRESVKASMATGALAAQFDSKTGEEAVAATIEYARAAKPAEIKSTGMTPAVLESNAKAKVVEVAIATTAAENSNTPGASSTVAAKLP